MIGKPLLDKLAEGDANAISHFKEILRLGAIENEQILEIQTYIAEAMLAQNFKGREGVLAKFDLLGISAQLDEVRATPLKAGVASKDFYTQVAAACSISQEESARIWDYNYLIEIAMVTPQSDISRFDQDDETSERIRKNLSFVNSKAYEPVIKLGAALARSAKGEAERDARFVEAARLCLLNAALYGSDEVSKYALEALKSIPGAETKDYLLDRIWAETGETREKAIGAVLRHFSDDKVTLYSLTVMARDNRDIASIIAGIAKESEDDALRLTAGQVMASRRQEGERVDAVSDREFLLETEYPDPTSPQRLYVECVFDAIEKVLGARPATRNDLEIAVNQLATWGISPGQIEGIFETRNDKHNLSIIIRNVENALIHALTTYDGGIREQVAAVLERIGSDKVENVLDKIVQRYGEKHEIGALASETLASIRGEKVEIIDVSFQPLMKKPPRPPQQAISQRPRLSQ